MKKQIKFVESIPGTADLKPPELEVTYEMETSGDEEHERIKMAYFEKNFEVTMRKKFKEQIKHYAVPLASMQKDIDEMRARYNLLTNEKDMNKLVKQIDEARVFLESITVEIKKFNGYIGGMVKNTAEQQIYAWAGTVESEAESAAKKQIKKDIKWKKFRHVVGAGVKGLLVLGVAAAAIAVTIVTFGAAAPGLAIALVAFASLGGLTALGKVGKDISSKYDLEKRAITLLEADFKAIQTLTGAIASKTEGLPKHLDDASRYCTERKPLIMQTRQALAVFESKTKTLVNDLKALKDLKVVAKKMEELTKIQAEQLKAQKTLSDAEARDAEFTAFLEKARGVIIDLGKIPTVGARSLVDSLQRYNNVGTLIAGLDAVSSLGGSIVGLKAAP